MDTLLTLQGAVRDIEDKLGVGEHRWRPGNPEWIEADKLETEVEYDKAVDALEGLVVARLFELSRLNHAGIGEYTRIVDMIDPLIVFQDTKCVGESVTHSKIVHEQSRPP